MKLFIILIFLSTQAHCWSPKLIEQWDKTSPTFRPQMKPTFATFWGGLRRAVHFDQNKGEMRKLLVSGFHKTLPVYIQSSRQKRDLIVFYPGIFGRPNTGVIPRVIDGLETKDVHVAVVPNLLESSYLISHSSSHADPIESEKLNQQRIFKAIIQQIGRSRIRKIFILAESLGSLQALTTFAPPFLDHYPIASLTFLWPPLYLDRAVERFDALIVESLSIQAKCSFWWKWPHVLWQTKFSTFPSGLTNHDKDCLGSWVIADRFVSAIRDTAEKVIDAKSLGLDSLPETFASFIDTITPGMTQVLRRKDPRLSVNYLLAYYRGHQSKMRFVSSVDDFINAPQEWTLLKTNHPQISSEIYLFTWGGHSGPIGMDSFLESIY
jgi:hypothetical protein